MLMMSRRVGERIVIGGDVEIHVAQIHRGTIRLAINAPGYPGFLGEVWDAIAAANRDAAADASDITSTEDPPPLPLEEPTHSQNNFSREQGRTMSNAVGVLGPTPTVTRYQRGCPCSRPYTMHAVTAASPRGECGGPVGRPKARDRRRALRRRPR